MADLCERCHDELDPEREGCDPALRADCTERSRREGNYEDTNDIEQRLASMSAHELRSMAGELIAAIHAGSRGRIDDVLREWDLEETRDDDEDEED